MDALGLLGEQAATADDLMRQVFASVTPEQATWRQAGSIANQIGPTFVHAYVSEDRVVHGLSGTPTVFESGGWQRRLNYDPSARWAEAQQVDPEACRAYATEVRAATKQLLDDSEPSMLEQTMNGPTGPMPARNGLSLILVMHKLMHMGEIAAQLGVQGHKGLPF